MTKKLPPSIQKLIDEGLISDASVTAPAYNGEVGNVSLFDTEGKVVGGGSFKASSPYDYDTTEKFITPKNTSLDDSLRKKGIMTNVYKGVEEFTGRKILPDDAQSLNGFQFQDKHGFGKDFGVSEEQLQKMLSHKDSYNRQKRQKGLEDALNATVDNLTNSKSLDEFYNMPDAEKLIEKRVGNLNPTTNTQFLLRNSVKEVLGEAGENLGEAALKLKGKIPNLLSKVKSIAPIAGGVGGMLLSGASEASDAEDLGNTNEQEALLREDDAQKQMKQIQNSNSVSEDVKLQALELFRKNKLPY